MKRISFGLLLAALLTAACNQNKMPVDGYRSPADLYLDDDSLIYGTCGRASTMNTLQLITTSNNDTLTLDLSPAREAGRVFGNYAFKDELCVAVNADTTQANLVINKSALLGDWVRPNPLDGSTETGFSLREGGEAESIDLTDILFRSWRLKNGLLQIIEVREDGTDVEDARTFSIIRLTPDSLILREEGVEMDPNMRESDLIQEYGRLKMVPEEDLGIQLDDGMSEDFRM